VNGARQLLDQIFGQPVVDVRRAPTKGAGDAYAVVLADGTVMALGVVERIRNPQHLSRRLAELGRPPVAKVGARCVAAVVQHWPDG